MKQGCNIVFVNTNPGKITLPIHRSQSIHYDITRVSWRLGLPTKSMFRSCPLKGRKLRDNLFLIPILVLVSLLGLSYPLADALPSASAFAWDSAPASWSPSALGKVSVLG
jgi:hypothetical protein